MLDLRRDLLAAAAVEMLRKLDALGSAEPEPLTKRTCLYCNVASPFTDEHVFPAGLGGDDRRYLLKNLVCEHCNTGIFSKLEGRFMRSSTVAIGNMPFSCAALS
ncbi:hypothetical protein GO998_13865 [Ralstonia syzygii]|uniref:HNH endonuclease 5 domain-containing protein n=1 Tax=Ralstonia syzygii TaxID=28097 RepID=A0ABX7ZIM1_9RALS|nr:HNH endonuclease [Ralstonia syzygii]QUP54739.1 hypothetical protein GO998_13865 [Ralstonia syzygii]